MFEAAVRHRSPAAIVTLSGNLDAFSSPKLRVQLDKLTRSIPLVVDLREVDFMDSTGASTIVAIHRKTLLLRLVRGPERVQSVFEITGLLPSLAFYDTPEQALHAPIFG